jgi:hypothetical protein
LKASSVAEAAAAHAAPNSATSTEGTVEPSLWYGKSRFFAEFNRLLHGQLFGHGSLRLESRPKDYREMCMYSRSSSSGEMTTAKEKTYKLARALGAPSNSRIIANVDYRVVGLLLEKAAVDFADRCTTPSRCLRLSEIS